MFRRNWLTAFSPTTISLSRAATCIVFALAFNLVALNYRASSRAADAKSAGPNANEQAPYQARVVGEDVYVRSGPGTDYYPTAKLQAGDVVEVFRRDPGGWCAIRPPRNSFCFVARQKLKPLGQSVAVAREGKVEVHVGSAMGDMRDVIQVRLDRDEPVEVLEEPDHDRPDAWVKVAPPAGEFRWISSRFLDHHAPDVARSRGANNNRDPYAPAPAEPRRWTEFSASAGAAHGGAGASLGSADSAGAQHSGARASAASSREIESLNHELSARVVRDISQWQFDDLKQRSTHALDVAATDADRNDAQQLLNKIGRFEDIRQRREAFQRGGGIAGVSQLAAARAPNPATASLAVDPRYDGFGQLIRINSPKTSSPRFALLDASGAVVQYVAPAPDINLQPYVGKQIGVSGPRSYMPEYSRQLISAQRITLLDDGTRRF